MNPSSLTADRENSPSSRVPDAPDSITCFIAGFRYHEGLDITAYLKAGEALELIAEPDNPHDPNAVRIEHRKSRIGYVPRRHNAVVAGWLRSGSLVHARINRVDWERPPWEAVEIQIAASAAV